jgi:hypothetical protein
VFSVLFVKLLDFFRNGYVYNVFRWQHIRCRHRDGNLELVLLDLESLKEVTDETEDHVTRSRSSRYRSLWELWLPVPLLVPFLQRMRLSCYVDVPTGTTNDKDTLSHLVPKCLTQKMLIVEIPYDRTW